MNYIIRKSLFIITIIFVAVYSYGQDSKRNKEIITAMDAEAQMWNNGDLNGYMALYDPSATMMMRTEPVHIDSIRKVYEQYYFTGNKPKQELQYENYQIRSLGKNYALLTGRFILKATDKLPQRTGTFSLTMVHRKKGWKILHDHSG